MLVLAGAVALSYSLPIGIGHRRPDRHRGQLVPPDDPRLPAGRRRLHRHQGQPRHAAGAGGGRRAADRLRPDGGGERRGRRRGRHLGGAGAVSRTASGCASLAVVAVAVANLRGIRESGKIFAAPTYLFIASLCAHDRLRQPRGALRLHPARRPIAPHPPGLEGVGLFLLLRAFASGCTALTGVEAVSDGVPAFKPPEAQNARIVLAWLGVILIVLFLGITYLAYDFGILPRPERDGGLPARPPRLRRRARSTTRSRRVTMLILLLAANTSFADFPRLCLLPGARPLHPAPVRDAGRPAGLLQRHPHPGRAGRRSCSCSSAATPTPSSRSTRSASSSPSRCRRRAWCAAGSACRRRAGGGAAGSTGWARSSPASSCSPSPSPSSPTAPGSSSC